MTRPIAIVGAPSSIGLRLYDDGGVRRVDLAPDTFRELGIAKRLDAFDLGDILPPQRYVDVERPSGRPRNESDVMAYSRKIAEKIGATVSDDNFTIMLGGDCSILFGALLGLKETRAAPIGLIYIDGHSDFADLNESPSRSPCSMCLALAVGRVDTDLTHIGGEDPLLRAENLVHIGARDETEPYGYTALEGSAALTLPCRSVRSIGFSHTIQAALDHLAHCDGGIWVHVDVDVLDSTIMPAVDTPLPGGFALHELATLLTPLVRDARVLGLQLTIYDPKLDPERHCAQRLMALLEDVFIVRQ